MTTTPDGAATTWRDLADQLTPDQVAKLEGYEADWLMHARDPGLMRVTARERATYNVIGALCAGVPEPAASIEVCEWQE